MALNIKNTQVEQLATEVAGLTGETKTQAIKRALEERRERMALGLAGSRRRAHWVAFLARDIWPELAKGRKISKAQREAILGYREGGI